MSSPRYDPERTEVVACPFPDGRRGLPMNRTAQRQVASAWPEALATLASLTGPSPTVHDAWRTALVGICLPLTLPTPTPRPFSALYKASLGLSQVTATLLLGADGVADEPFASLGDGPAFFTALDAHGWLLGQVQVCAGTRGQLEQLGQALGGAPVRGEPLPTPQAALLADLAPRVVAGHATLWLTGRAVTAPPPWLRAVTSEPGRTLAQLRRLFPEGRTPDDVSGWIHHPPTLDELRRITSA